jgi:hypothetical protein
MQISFHHEDVTQPGQNLLEYYYSSNLPAMKLACGIPGPFENLVMRLSYMYVYMCMYISVDIYGLWYRGEISEYSSMHLCV